MKSEQNVQHVFNSKSHVDGYEQRAKQSNWVGPEMVFGLSYQYIQPQETILDIGIGTGLSSVLYHKAGLQVYGIDNSPKMLEICAGKKITVELQQHDLLTVPYPYDDSSMHHAVSAGVFHIFSDLAPVFAEVARIVKPQGIFVFSLMDYHDGEERETTVQSDQFPGQTFTLYRYNEAEIDDLLTSHGFTRLNVVEFTMNHAQKRTCCKAYLAQREE
jgi:predicted TPR repeat methyltransferase